MTYPCLRDAPNGVFLQILVVPRASRTEVVEIVEDRCRIRIKAPPVDGEANKTLIKALSQWFAVPKTAIQLTQGLQGKRKTALLNGVAMDHATSVLASLLAQS